MADHDAPNRKLRFTVLAVVVAGAIALLWWPRSNTTAPKTAGATPGANTPDTDDMTRAAPQMAPRAHTPLASGRPTWEPGKEHWYGNDKDPFIRQPHDYDMNTPEILGNRISYHVYDLETVQDMVARGDQADSEICRVRGVPLTTAERERGRRVIQEFFDETVPNVDSIIEGSMSKDEGFDVIGPRRRRLNRDLRAALGLSSDDFYAIWPHIRGLDENLDNLREPDPGGERPRLPQDEKP